MLISHTELGSPVLPSSTSRTVQKPAGVVRRRVDTRGGHAAAGAATVGVGCRAGFQAASQHVAHGRGGMSGLRFGVLDSNTDPSVPLSPALSPGMVPGVAAPSDKGRQNLGILWEQQLPLPSPPATGSS